MLDAGPDVLNHNIETVPRLYRTARPGGRYPRALDVLRRSREIAPGIPTKSGLMVGLGEEWDEVVATLADLRSAGCQIVTIGQYLRPSIANLPMVRYYAPAEFAELKRIALELGFGHVESGPLVRSSYHAHEQTQAYEAARVSDPSRSRSPEHRHLRPTCDRAAYAIASRIAIEKKAAHRGDVYWGRPVPGFGDPDARLLVLGLAPAAHGANRTGRVFTGDGSGDFLMRAMHRAGFANIPTSQRADDGLVLTDAYIAAAVRCAPPDNKPTPDEIAACHAHLIEEVEALPNLRAHRVPRKNCVRCRLAPSRLTRHRRPSPAGLRSRRGLSSQRSDPSSPLTIPSRQNTNTGRLTPPMLASVFQTASAHVRSPQTLALG